LVAIFFRKQLPSGTLSGSTSGINSLRHLANSVTPSTAKKTSADQGFANSSRLSQNAAALLFDLGTVDIR
jgi:hypothetical protein